MDIKDIKKQNLKFVSKPISKEFFGEAPGVFVGRYNYPNVNVGILSPPSLQDTEIFDAPNKWAANGFGITEVMDLRSQLVNSRFKANIRAKQKLIELTQELAMAKKPVDIEVTLEKEVKPKTHIYRFSAPTGPNALLEKVRMTENPNIDSKVYKVVDATDLNASDAINYLYRKNFDENFLAKLLSVGNLGVKAQRKLVPSRWSITATHDALGKSMINEIKDYTEGNYSIFIGGYLGNCYLVLLFPNIWGYELFEQYVPDNYTGGKLAYERDYELYSGRKNYAKSCAGGYYTARLAVLEYLSSVKRQATALALRFVSSEYQHSLGVWVTLAACRNAMASKPIEFSSKELMLQYATDLVKKKFGYDLLYVLSESVILKNVSSQTKLSKFM